MRPFTECSSGPISVGCKNVVDNLARGRTILVGDNRIVFIWMEISFVNLIEDGHIGFCYCFDFFECVSVEGCRETFYLSCFFHFS